MARIAAFWMALSLSISATAAAQPVEPLRSGQILKGRFEQTRHLNGFSEPLRATGDFLIAGGRGLIWRITTPIQSTLVVTNTSVTQPSGQGAGTRVPLSASPVMASIRELFVALTSGETERISLYFEVEQQTQGNEWRLICRPRSEAVRRDIAAISLRGRRFLESMELQKPNGDRDVMAFYEQAVGDGPLAESDAKLLDDGQ